MGLHSAGGLEHKRGVRQQDRSEHYQIAVNISTAVDHFGYSYSAYMVTEHTESFWENSTSESVITEGWV